MLFKQLCRNLIIMGAVLAFAAAPVNATAEAEALLAESSEAMLALQSFHAVLTTTEGETELIENISLGQIDADVVLPDRFLSEIELVTPIASLTLTAVGIEDKVWVENPLTGGGRFELIVGGDAGGFTLPEYVNPQWLVTLALESIADPQIVGNESIDDINATRVDGTIDLATATESGTPVADDGDASDISPIPVSIWIDESNRVIRIEFSGPILPSESESGDLVRRIDISKFNEPVVIEAPV